MTTLHIPEIAAWLSFGLLIGLSYMYMIRLTVSGIATGSTWLSAAAYLLVRVALAVVCLVFAAGHGAVALLLVLSGFLIARMIFLSLVREN